ncbi:MAG: cupredoxin domain-containing protein [Acidimicrobiales bacterium]
MSLTRWMITGTTLGVSAALSAGIAFAVASPPAAPAAPAASKAGPASPAYGAIGTMGSAGSVMGSAGPKGSNYGAMGSGIGSAGPKGSNYGTMGSGMSGGGAGRRGTVNNTVNNSSLAGLVRHGEQGAVIDAKTNTVTYKSQAVNLVALASPHGKPNMTWEIDGLVNPTVVVPPNAHLNVVLVNTDWGYMHGFELTTTAPPYPHMAMAGVVDSFFLMPLPPRTTHSVTTASYYTRTGSITPPAGTYHYLCPVPGHAAAGMFGTLVVR